MKILDLSAGNRAIWFDKDHPCATYIDIRPEVDPDFVADSRALPADVGDGYSLVVFDPPHKNNAATGNMVRNYGHWTHEEIRSIVTETAKEAHRVAAAFTSRRSSPLPRSRRHPMTDTILERSEKPDGTIVDIVRLADGSEVKREYSYICSICGAVDNEHPFPRSAISCMRRGCKA